MWGFQFESKARYGDGLSQMRGEPSEATSRPTAELNLKLVHLREPAVGRGVCATGVSAGASEPQRQDGVRIQQ